MSRKIEYQFVHDVHDIEEIVSFQETIWGRATGTGLPHLVASIYNGGSVIGAYDNQQLVGFCYGFPGFKDGKNMLVSHMMAVNPLYRDQGIGEQLKYKQKEWAKSYGYEKIVWTFDPLESRNAYLNLSKLGGYVQTYICSYYGDLNDEINQGLPADRLFLEWDLTQNTIEYQSTAQEITKLVDWEGEIPLIRPVVRDIPLDESYFLIAVPANIHVIKKENRELAMLWRYTHREIFQRLFSRGYVVM
ncbi:GNAT family N-acetyltransferase [Anaerobacillus alkaliphilus]|uniref:GNAT family N-acetyltransferase n=1 Tax=Anaerobacillus alkaliphilus TaxID=1548597 RepID=A0A4Q0VMX2_9BACI|nr:GNAT family N-acetyltransferase [Anaerobacillus alkaliphilus]RXI96180.1 GNAT family N-acetyltransferase [Anaerobacillus alkaliphilus]